MSEAMLTPRPLVQRYSTSSLEYPTAQENTLVYEFFRQYKPVFTVLIDIFLLEWQHEERKAKLRQKKLSWFQLVCFVIYIEWEKGVQACTVEEIARCVDIQI